MKQTGRRLVSIREATLALLALIKGSVLRQRFYDSTDGLARLLISVAYESEAARKRTKGHNTRQLDRICRMTSTCL